ncbi:uncharacterized protein KQ657_004837 [Scheffersomyces spartinae]|uniref:C3HC-type domain-containing protein n=1 Tax=Scheffersomyces spartinae TaxID=45513 RepID=A0A9P8AIS8_9ASCO|nr:uncharacterized protein KQ657_004837 [Scheffersomyces spartinae]KAG7194129.1 hypothetical protein KQ657_004837 [Scheffersomyces spartinae]
MNYTVAATSEDYLTDILDAKDYININKELEDVYYKQVTGSGHGSSCIWRNFETPLDGVYYLTPHLNSSNTIWINEYLVSLKNLIDNTKTLTECLSNYIVVFDVDDNELMTRFIQVSNKLLLSKHYQDSASGSSTLPSAISYTPNWLYKLAVLGWNLNVQSFGNQLVLLLICSKCNKRLFLDSCNHSPIPKHDVTKVDKNLKLSQANVLSPCPVPITVDNEQDEEEDNQLDLIGEHKPSSTPMKC